MGVRETMSVFDIGDVLCSVVMWYWLFLMDQYNQKATDIEKSSFNRALVFTSGGTEPEWTRVLYDTYIQKTGCKNN